MSFPYSGRVVETLKSWSVRLKDLHDRVSTLEESSYDEWLLTEVLTKKRFLGKPVYRKVIDVAPLPNATNENTAHGITNLDSIVSISGYGKNSTPTTIPLPWVDHDGGGNHCEIYANSTNVRKETNANLSGYTEAYIALEYTKTTD